MLMTEAFDTSGSERAAHRMLLCLFPSYIMQLSYLVELCGVFILVQSHALPVQDPVMAFPLSKDTTELKADENVILLHKYHNLSKTFCFFERFQI